MKIQLIFLALLIAPIHAEPQAPIVRQLEPEKITEIPIHRGMDTLLIFPKPVTLILGMGLTDGSVDGVVQYQHEGDPKLVILRQLKEKAAPLMQIMLSGEEKAYVFRLHASERPASVIRYVEVGKELIADKLSEEELAQFKVKPSKARQAELMRLTAEASFLQKRIPDEYEGFQSKQVQFTSFLGNMIMTTTRIARFANEDALVVFGKIHNRSNLLFAPGNYLATFRIGGLKSYSPTQLLVSKRVIAPGEEAEFRGLMLGDGAGGAGHFSLENRITLELK